MTTRLRRGVTSIEYALLASSIAITIVLALAAAGDANELWWSVWTGKLATAIDAALGP